MCTSGTFLWRLCKHWRWPQQWVPYHWQQWKNIEHICQIVRADMQQTINNIASQVHLKCCLLNRTAQVSMAGNLIKMVYAHKYFLEMLIRHGITSTITRQNIDQLNGRWHLQERTKSAWTKGKMMLKLFFFYYKCAIHHRSSKRVKLWTKHFMRKIFGACETLSQGNVQKTIEFCCMTMPLHISVLAANELAKNIITAC